MKVAAVNHHIVVEMIAAAYLTIVGIEHLGERLAMVEEHVLPLAHVAQIVVVHQYHLDRCLLLHDGAKLLNAHLETAVACEETDSAVGSTECSTYGCRKSESHCAESATCHYTQLALVLEVAAREHLVLTYIIHQYCLAIGGLSHGIHYLAHEQRSFLRMNGWLDDLLGLLL